MTQLLPALILLALCFTPPLLVFLVVLVIKRQEAGDDRRSPLKEKLLHQPGSQARAKYDELGTEYMSLMAVLALIGPLAMLTMLLPRVQWARLQLTMLDWGLAIGVPIGIAMYIRKLVALRTERCKWRAGMLAEMATAQELDRLRSEGVMVFHDLPTGQAFNIDHVLIGSSAVYAVETKSRRKAGQGRASANVVYDGRSLTFSGRWSETKPLEQARAQARWLEEYLRRATGEATPVIPVLCIPGWFVETDKHAHQTDVKVINPKMTRLFSSSGRRPGLEASRRMRIEHALSQCYPELEVN